MVTITSKDNPFIKNAAKLNKSAKFRRESGSFGAEGVRICIDAMKSGAEIETFFSSESACRRYPEEFSVLRSRSERTFTVSDKIFSQMCDTDSPQGFFCIIKALDKTACFDTIKNSDKFLALDRLQDPGNLGTILRTAEALGITGVVVSRDSCDIYSPKVVRGSMGAVFRLPVITVDSAADFIANHSELYSYASVVSNDADIITDVEFKPPCIVAVGNEGSGLSAKTVGACNRKITVPMAGSAESLNAAVAASIIMWEMIK